MDRIPKRSLAVLTCMDARVDPFRILRAALGDIHVIRNAGGLVTDDALRSLVISQRFLNTNRIIVMMHTDCGMQGLDDDQAAASIAEETGHRPPFRLGGFDDLESELRHGVERLRGSDHLPHRDQISGSVYDVTSQTLKSVVP